MAIEKSKVYGRISKKGDALIVSVNEDVKQGTMFTTSKANLEALWKGEREFISLGKIVRDASPPLTSPAGGPVKAAALK